MILIILSSDSRLFNEQFQYLTRTALFFQGLFDLRCGLMLVLCSKYSLEKGLRYNRLKRILTSLGEKATTKRCARMTGIVAEGDEMMGEEFAGARMDTALISAAQRVEHYEIAPYCCVHTWAQALGQDSAAELLEKP